MNTSTAGCIRHQTINVTQGVPHTIPGLRNQHSNTTMTWRTGKDVPSLLNWTPQRFYFCGLHISKAHQAPRNHSNIQSICCAISLGPCSLVSNSVKRDSRGCNNTPSSKASKNCQRVGHCCKQRTHCFHKHQISLHWRKRLDCTQPGHRCTVAWCAHLSTFHWSFHAWRPVPTSFH